MSLEQVFQLTFIKIKFLLRNPESRTKTEGEGGEGGECGDQRDPGGGVGGGAVGGDSRAEPQRGGKQGGWSYSKSRRFQFWFFGWENIYCR